MEAQLQGLEQLQLQPHPQGQSQLQGQAHSQGQLHPQLQLQLQEQLQLQAQLGCIDWSPELHTSHMLLSNLALLYAVIIAFALAAVIMSSFCTLS